jgi:hypothetical protein
MTFSTVARVVARNVSDKESLKRVVSSIPLSDGSTNIQLGLAKALSALAEEKSAKKEIYLITDRRRSGWNVDEVAEWQRIDRVISNMSFVPKIHVIDVGSPDMDNAALSSVDIEAADSSMAGNYQIRIEAQAYGSALLQTSAAKFYVDDMAEEQSRITGGNYENGVSEAKQPFKLEDEGFHYGKVELLEADALEQDNSRYFSVRHSKGLPVLCVEGQRKGGLFKTSADLVRIALAPEKDMSGNIIIAADYTNLMAPELVPLSNMYEKHLADYEVIILSNTPSFDEHDYESLDYFVSRGGGLAIFLGDGVEPDRYNALYRNRDTTLLPARIASLNGTPSAKERKPGDPEYVLSEFDYMHPVMKNFKAAQDGDLTLFKFHAYYRAEVDESDPDTKVLSRFNNGDPFIIEKKVGRGKVLLVTSGPSFDWSNLSTRPAFLPFIHHMTRYLAGDTSGLYNLTVGQPISYPLESHDTEATMVGPSGTAFKLQPVMGDDEHAMPFLNFEETSIAGIYTLHLKGATVNDEDGSDRAKLKDKVCFAVNPDPIESDLTPLDAEVMKGMLSNIDLNLVKYDRDFGRKIRESRYGREIWRYFMLAALVFLITEVVLAYMIDRT